MRLLRAHPTAVTLFALGLAVVAVVSIAAAYGFGAFGDAWQHLNFGWLALVVGGVFAALPCYTISYRALARVDGGPRVPPSLLVRIVIAGFGLIAAGGGFWLDKRALHALDGDERSATIRVLGLGALEWALLAPIACVCAIAMLIFGRHHVMPSLLWPWAIAVPVGFAVGLWLAVPERRERIGSGGGAVRAAVYKGLCGVHVLYRLAQDLPRGLRAAFGMALYWCFEIAAFYGALRFIGLHTNVGETVLAYATGYALTRRSIPLGGAGVTETLMTFALHWVGQPVAPALAAVIVYRLVNVALPAVPALLVHPEISDLMARHQRKSQVPTERRQARASLS